MYLYISYTYISYMIYLSAIHKVFVQMSSHITVNRIATFVSMRNKKAQIKPSKQARVVIKLSVPRPLNDILPLSYSFVQYVHTEIKGKPERKFTLDVSKVLNHYSFTDCYYGNSIHEYICMNIVYITLLYIQHFSISNVETKKFFAMVLNVYCSFLRIL